MDAVLHRERLDGRAKRLSRGLLGDLPDGVFVALDGRPHAVREGRLWPWTFEGYRVGASIDARREADVLTPPSTVAALKAGYRPLWS